MGIPRCHDCRILSRALRAADKPVSIVLVHGAFVDGSGWQAVFDILTGDGYEVLVVQNPTISLSGDVAATNRVIAAASKPVVLVGHSYGGMVITEAGDNPKVQSLVYLAAFAPDAEESVASLAEQPVPAGRVGRAPAAAERWLPAGRSVKISDCFRRRCRSGGNRLHGRRPGSVGAWKRCRLRSTKVAWKAKPSHFMVTTKDMMIPPTFQRAFAKRASATTVEIDSSHAVMLSHPQEVAAFIETAASAK